MSYRCVEAKAILDKGFNKGYNGDPRIGYHKGYREGFSDGLFHREMKHPPYLKSLIFIMMKLELFVHQAASMENLAGLETSKLDSELDTKKATKMSPEIEVVIDILRYDKNII